MKTYLLSVLAIRFGMPGARELTSQHPHDWLVWEPGAWHAPRKGGTTLIAIQPQGPLTPTAGESLAIALEPRADGAEVTLGRAEEADLVLNDGTLSSIHLGFGRRPDGSWIVRDVGSKNGTWLDGQRLLPGATSVLSPGARLTAGQVVLTFYDPPRMTERLRGFLASMK